MDDSMVWRDMAKRAAAVAEPKRPYTYRKHNSNLSKTQSSLYIYNN